MRSLTSSLHAPQPLGAELEQIIEATFGRLQAGEAIDVDALVAAHPQYAAQLRDLLPTIESLLKLGRDKTSLRSNSAEATVATRPMQLGDFRIVREIGRGGMGIVYEAEQLSMGRRVALKVLPFAAIAHDKSLQRFRNEVRAAAALDHPHIVSVYSVGEERGVHYYAMQLVRGQSVADLIAELRAHRRQLDPNISGRAELDSPNSESPTVDAASSSPATSSTINEQALVSTAIDAPQGCEFYRIAARLGLQAALALQHAHDQGVLHRDIKPGNFMLDAAGQLYVTDFGLARIESDAGMTMTGDLVGTLRYMAPEQALAKRTVYDHRADVYSLGATLYELLTLHPAFGETDRSELLKQIAFEEPRPLRKIDRRIPAELEIIVLTAMAKQPDERYQSAQRLADDLAAFLEDRPIKAKPPTLLNRATKWSRRHRGLLLWTSAVLVLLTVGSITSTARLLWERKQTELAAAESRAVVTFLVSDLLAAPKDEKKLDREVTVTDVLVNAEAKISKALADQPLVEASVRQVMAETYRALKKFDKAEPHARRALKLRSELLGPVDHNTLESTDTMAEVLIGEQRYDEAKQLCSDSLAATRRDLGAQHPDTLASMRRLSKVVIERNDRADAEHAQKLCEQTLELCRKVLGPENRETLSAMNNLGIVLYRCGYIHEADALFDQTLEISRRVLAPDDPLAVELTKNVASRLVERGQLTEAADKFEKILASQRAVLGGADPDTIDTMMSLANADVLAGKYDEAVQLCEEALKYSRELYGPDHGNTLGVVQELSYALRGQGKFDKARDLQQQVLDWRKKHWGPEDGSTIAAMIELAYVIQLQGKFDEAIVGYDEAIALGSHVLGPDDVSVLKAKHDRSRVLNKQGNVEEARQAQEEVLAARRRVVGPDDPETLGSMCVLAVLCAKQGKLDESRKLTHELLDRLPAKEWQVRNSLAWFLCTAKSAEIRDGRTALELAIKSCELTDYKATTCIDTLAAAYAEQGDFAAATEWEERTVQLTSDASRRARYLEHLNSYRNGKPWRDP